MLGDKIGSGNFRDYWVLQDRPGFGIKIPKPFEIGIPGLVNAILDLNKIEFDNYSSLGLILKDYIPNMELSPSGLICERLIDYHGAPSSTLEHKGPIKDESFWQGVDRIYQILSENEFWLLDIFSGGNIVAQEIEEGKFIPKIIDLKRYGYYSFPLQIGLLTTSGKQSKLKRRHQRLHQTYQA